MYSLYSLSVVQGVNFEWPVTLVSFEAAGAPGEDRRQIGDAHQKIDEPEAADAAAHERIGDERPEDRPVLREVVALPEFRPGQHHQQQPDFEEVRDEQEAPEQGGYPRARTLASRSIRAATSR